MKKNKNTKKGLHTSKKLRLWYQFVNREIVIDYKTCLYFSCIMIFYFAYLAILHIYSASILYMFEMLMTAYIISYLQVYLLHIFDEAEKIGLQEILFTMLCSSLYTVTSYLLNWFNQNHLAALCFFCYVAFCYWCIYFANKIKRSLDTKLLNEMLNDYKYSTSKEEQR